jgi:hypothetical protein
MTSRTSGRDAMSPRTAPSGPARYELRVDGHLDEHWSTWFGGFSLTREADGTTTLRGVVTDQAELHGLLARVRDVGATLLSVRAVDPSAGQGRDLPGHRARA